MGRKPSGRCGHPGGVSRKLERKNTADAGMKVMSENSGRLRDYRN